MSVFNRNEKTTDPNPANSPVRDSTEHSTPPVSAESKAPQAVAQPITRMSTTRTMGVSVISKALKITGQLESTEDIQIDGEVDGDVRGVSVKVGSGAKVKGTVYGDEVELSGTVEGKIEAKKVVLTSTAHMAGDVVHHDIRIDSGAFIDGHCKPDHGKADGRASAPRPASATRETEKPVNGGTARV